MKQRDDEAYVLSTRELGEADLIVSLFAQGSGKVRGVARSGRRSRKRFGGALEPLTRVRAIWSEKQGRDLQQIESLEVARSFAEMQADPVRQAGCAVLVELCEVFAREGEPDPKSFDLLGAVLEALEGGVDVWAALRYFERWLLRLHGLLPPLDTCRQCAGPLAPTSAAYVLRGVGVVCANCRQSGARRITADDRAFLDFCSKQAPARLPATPGAARPGGAVETLLRGTLEEFAERPFRSYRYLSAMIDPPTSGGGPR